MFARQKAGLCIGVRIKLDGGLTGEPMSHKRRAVRVVQTQIPPSQATSPSRNRQVRWDWPAVSELGFHASPPESARHSRSRSRSS